MSGLRRAAIARLTRWSARRHGRDGLPLTVHRRRIYIIPTRIGLTLALLLVAMLLAGLNYNSNLGLAFGFLMTSLALVAMNHCHRNLLGLTVDAPGEIDAFAGSTADFEFVLRNAAGIERCDIEIHCGGEMIEAPRVPAGGYQQVSVPVPAPARGTIRLERFELRTRHPFGWFRAWTYVQAPLLAYVAPQPRGHRRVPPAVGGARDATPGESRGDEDYAGLRPYQPGIPLKHMAWKVLARGGEAAVRSYTGPAAQPEWLDWWMLAPLGTELRLAQLCRFILDAERAGRAYGLRLPGVEIPPGRGPAHRTTCLRALAAHPADTGR